MKQKQNDPEEREETSSGPGELRGLVLITAPWLLGGPCSLKVRQENLPVHLGETPPQPLNTLVRGANTNTPSCFFPEMITVLCTVPPKLGPQQEPCLRSDTL